MSVITKVIVSKKIPYTPLAAWVVADYLEEAAEDYANQRGGRFLTPPLERLIGHLYHAPDSDLTKDGFLQYWELSHLHGALTPADERCIDQLINDTLIRFWE